MEMDKMFEGYKDIVTVSDISRMLGIGKSSAYTLLKNNQIRHVRVGRKYIAAKQSVVDFVRGVCYNNTG